MVQVEQGLSEGWGKSHLSESIGDYRLRRSAETSLLTDRATSSSTFGSTDIRVAITLIYISFLWNPLPSGSRNRSTGCQDNWLTRRSHSGWQRMHAVAVSHGQGPPRHTTTATLFAMTEYRSISVCSVWIDNTKLYRAGSVYRSSAGRVRHQPADG